MNNDSYSSTDLILIKKFLQDLIVGLSDETYIQKLQNTRQPFMYENLMRSHLSMISDDLIDSVFSGLWSDIINNVEYFVPEDSVVDEFEIYRRAMTKIVLSFNELTYFSKNLANYCYMSLCTEISPQNSNHMHDSVSIKGSNTTSQTNIYGKPTFTSLLRYFILIYERKFIFGDIKSKFANLNFY
ncbi:hypothetical protein RF11_08056 [Thelohanellus kitauei]|uniref:Uncharacterized protein n=1 Tax=Thelohanellus kitauei TaxID=669202 RepID=A0A0C2MPD2_THEKT|nr:hypothetical protein RF11_08056 [Thelohanellus kitauei]